MHVLIVDDDELALMMLECALVRAGYKVSAAENVKRFLAVIRRGEIGRAHV